MRRLIEKKTGVSRQFWWPKWLLFAKAKSTSDAKLSSYFLVVYLGLLLTQSPHFKTTPFSLAKSLVLSQYVFSNNNPFVNEVCFGDFIPLVCFSFSSALGFGHTHINVSENKRCLWVPMTALESGYAYYAAQPTSNYARLSIIHTTLTQQFY